MSKTVMTMIAGLVLAGAGWGCRRGDDATTARPEIRLTYSIFFPATHIQAQRAAEWAAEIERRLDGRVRIDIFAGGTLTKAEQCYQGVVDGVSDIGMSCLAYTRGRFPLLKDWTCRWGIPTGVPPPALPTRCWRFIAPPRLPTPICCICMPTAPAFWPPTDR